MMVLQIMKWNVLPGKAKEYSEWAQQAISKTVQIPGVVEFRAYRPASGKHQVVVTYEFADMEAWAKWQGSKESQDVLLELRNVACDVSIELWGPSPVAPEPIRPAG